jgi:hypothetical protein
MKSEIALNTGKTLSLEVKTAEIRKESGVIISMNKWLESEGVTNFKELSKEDRKRLNNRYSNLKDQALRENKTAIAVLTSTESIAVNRVALKRLKDGRLSFSASGGEKRIPKSKAGTAKAELESQVERLMREIAELKAKQESPAIA